jgi:hypothetical protein
LDGAIRAWVLELGGRLLKYFVYDMTDAIALGVKTEIPVMVLLGLIAGLHTVEEGKEKAPENWNSG